MSGRRRMSLRSNDVSFGGSPRIHAGEERFSAPGKSCTLIMRFGAGLERFQGYKAHSKMERFSAGLKSSSPLPKQGAPTSYRSECGAAAASSLAALHRTKVR